ncbi:MAG: GNAT family N-acetyltransferase [Methylovulum sp.]|nr:GNAT family N-acetyltransferase [Methylovulum sp.]
MALIQTLPNGRQIALQQNENKVSLVVDGHAAVKLQLTTCLDSVMALHLSDMALTDSDAAASLLGLALHALFDSRLLLRCIEISFGNRGDLRQPLLSFGLAVVNADLGETLISRRGMLRQIPELYLPQSRPHAFPHNYTMTNGKRHPLRGPVAVGEVYRRYLPDLAATISFRTVDSDADLEVFHAWHNNPRVSAFWELEGSEDMHREYLQKVSADAHMHPVFGCFGGEPFGYFEIYWAKEDRIAPYYEVDDYDRGVHMLVGDERLRGPHRVAAWLPSLAHFMFLDDPRTRNVVAEPRADNAKMIGYMQQTGFCKPKEFDFPHKRAALMMLSREAFFDQFCV